MFGVIRGIAGRFLALPSYGIAATSLFVLYAVQAEIRFGAKARATRGGPSDRFSSDLFAILVFWDHCYASTVSAWPRVMRSSWLPQL